MTNTNYHFDTLQLHAGQTPDPTTKSRAVPIYQTTSYNFDNTQHGADLFSLAKPGNIYTRLMNPTTDVLEQRLAALEHGTAALAVASGTAAITYSILNLAQVGDEIISLSTLYGGTYTLFSQRMQPQFGIKVHLIAPHDLSALKTAINRKTKAIFLETIGNPDTNIPDFDPIAEIAHANGIPLIIDNTFGTPSLIKLKNHGADLIVHSLTKYIGGHGTSLGGALIDLGTFDFKNNPRYPQYNTPDPAYHGLIYADLGPGCFATRARVYLLRDTGAAISPFNSFLILQGLETLSLRVERHCRNAEKVADYLAAHPAVAWIKYPYLKTDPNHERFKKYLPKGCGGIFTFGLKGGKTAGIKFIDNLKLFSILANVADAKSLAIHPASTTHSQLSEEDLKKAGVPPEMIRLSIGLEDIRDIIADLSQALET